MKNFNLTLTRYSHHELDSMECIPYTHMHTHTHTHTHTHIHTHTHTWLSTSYKLSYRFSRFNRITVLPVSMQILIWLIFLHTYNKTEMCPFLIIASINYYREPHCGTHKLLVLPYLSVFFVFGKAATKQDKRMQVFWPPFRLSSRVRRRGRAHHITEVVVEDL